MDTNQALKILKDGGFKIEKSGKNYIYRTSIGDFLYSPRELVNFARTYTSEGQRLSFKKNVKTYSNKKNRTQTREDIHHERFENFDYNKPRKKDNIWNWD
jgi:hypothetical protein